MSSRPTERRSIASQLVWGFGVSAALLLCAGLGALYWIVAQHTREEDDAFLADKVRALSAFGEPREVGKLQANLETRNAGEPASYWIRVIDSGGTVVAETPQMGSLLPRESFPMVRSQVVPQNYRTGDKWFSLVAVRAQNGADYTFQVAQDRSADAEFITRFAVLLGGVLVTGGIAAAFIAILITRRGLRPLKEMTAAVKRIGPAQLHERVAPARWPLELAPLAKAFDGMLDRLEDSFRRLSQFSADLAHELRTPVANMRGEAEVALARPRTNEEYIEVLESTVGECEKLSGVIDGLLFVARADAADQRIQPTHFDGHAAVEIIAAYYETLADEQQVKVRCTGAGEVYADQPMFGRAVSNLVDNALRHTPPGGEIVMEVAAERERTTVSVLDNGEGIPAEHLPRVFDRFYRADPSRTAGGSGLGLALVKSIVELHGGRVEILSEIGKGTKVAMSFPRKAN